MSGVHTGLECNTVKKSGLVRNLAVGDCSSKEMRDLELAWATPLSLRSSERQMSNVRKKESDKEEKSLFSSFCHLTTTNWIHVKYRQVSGKKICGFNLFLKFKTNKTLRKWVVKSNQFTFPESEAWRTKSCKCFWMHLIFTSSQSACTRFLSYHATLNSPRLLSNCWLRLADGPAND